MQIMEEKSNGIFYSHQLRRITSASDSGNFIQEAYRLQITMKGAPDFSPTKKDYIYFEHTLFAYLNKALARNRKIRISKFDVDKEESELQLRGNSETETHVTAFTVLTGAKSSRREEDSNAMELEVGDDYEFSSEDERFAEQVPGDEADYEVENIDTESIEESINEQEANDRDLQSSSQNLLVLKIIIEGRDYTNLKGHFKKHVKGAIEQGSQKILDELETGGDIGDESSRRYFEKFENMKGKMRVTAMTETESGSESYSSSRSTGSGSSSESSSRAKEEAEPSDGNPTPGTDEDKEKKKPRGRPMNAKAIEFRIISGSIFLSLCLTAVLSNTIRILSRKREERRRRMEKAKNAYEVPRKAMMSSRGTSEKKFVGMLDDGDHYK